MESSCYVRGSARCCTLLVRHAMPRAFLTTCLSYRLLVPVFMHRVLVLCVTLIRALSVSHLCCAVLLCGYALQCFPTSRSLRGITRDASIFNSLIESTICMFSKSSSAHHTYRHMAPPGVRTGSEPESGIWCHVTCGTTMAPSWCHMVTYGEWLLLTVIYHVIQMQYSTHKRLHMD